MTRSFSFTASCLAAFFLAACSASDGGSDGERSAYKIDPASKCDPGATECAEDPSVPPCDPADTNCKPPPPPPVSTPCDAMSVKSDETCDTLLGYFWNGSSCTALNGCQCFGPDCNALFKSAEECAKKFAGCEPPQSWCEKTAAELASLLKTASACNIASAAAMACDGTTVPTVQGCPVPVASGSSKATVAYLALYKQYAEQCPLPVPACPNPKGLVIECMQGADIDGLWGTCGYAPPTSAGEAK